MTKLFKKLFSVLLCAAALCAMCAPVLAADSKPLRVGVSEYPGYAYYDSSGNPAGVDVEYAYKIAQFANLNIEIVIIPDAGDYFGALDSGSVDMLFDVLKTDSREKKYLYSDKEIGSSPLSVYVRKGDDRFRYGDTSQLMGIVYGSEEGSEVGDIFKQWCARRGFTPDIRLYKSSGDIDAAIDAGKIDAGLYGAENREGYETILSFSPTPYYITFRKDSESLKIQVDDAMSRILSEDPLYDAKLIEKYNSSSIHGIAAFTYDEKAYVAAHPVVTVAVIDGDAPYYSSSRSGGTGILPDYYAKLSEVTGLRFKFVVFKTQNEVISAVKTGGADMMGLYSSGLISAYNQGLRLTRTYSSVSGVLVTRSGTDSSGIKTIAVKDRSKNLISGSLAGMNAEFIVCDNAAECFAALNDGSADAMVCGLPSANWLVNQTSSSNYNVSPLSSLNMDLCGATSYGSDVLCSVIDKGVAATDYTFSGIVMNNTMPDSGWRTAIARIPTNLMAVILITMLALVLGLGHAVTVLSHRQRERAAVFAEKAETEREKVRLEEVEKSNEAKKQFFSNISHDMRTPLNAIIGFSELAKKEQVSPKAADYLGKIQSSGNLLLDLINDTLTMSKLGSGKLELHPEPVSTTEIFDSVVIPIRVAAAKRNITFIADDSQMAKRVIMADRLNLQKILLNLLTNAVKYTPEGGHVKFTVRTVQTGFYDSPDSIIIVSDDGIGISPEFLPHIFEPFLQENREGYESSGTGLGLAIVKQMVDQMDGAITVKSVLNEGTAFTVHLHFDAAPDSGEADAAFETEASDPDVLCGRKVLLCEDNALNREIACALLADKGVNMVTAENGRKGLEIFGTSAVGEYDAVLMDVRMPVMNGLEAASAIRALHRADAAAVPIIAMTADAFDDDVKKCISAGMNAHVAKPIDPDRLCSILSAAIRQRRTEEAS